VEKGSRGCTRVLEAQQAKLTAYAAVYELALVAIEVTWG
jgi:hypothetical protein